MNKFRTASYEKKKAANRPCQMDAYQSSIAMILYDTICSGYVRGHIKTGNSV